MSFNGRVWGTFDFRNFTQGRRGASVVTLSTALFAAAATTEQNFYTAVGLFFFSTLLTGSVLYMQTKGQVNVYDTDVFFPRAMFVPLLFGSAVIVNVAQLYILIARPPLGEFSFFRVLLPAIAIGVTEEFNRWMMMQTLPFGTITSLLLWVLLHPNVRVVFLLQPPDLPSVIFITLFGAAMTGILLARERFGEHGAGMAFGPGLTMALHVGLDAVLFMFAVRVGPLTLVPF